MEEKELSVKDMQGLELDMMKDLHEFCEQNNLCYALGFGSCLGAVRHNGFIPWDDDIDIIMPYPDYMKLIELKRYSKGRYQIHCIETDPDCSITFAKYVDTYTELNEEETISKPIGVYIDIFPVYGVPSNDKKLNSYIRELKIIDYLLSCSRKKTYTGKTIWRTIAQNIIGPYSKLKGCSHFINKTLHIVRKYPYSNSDYVAYMPATKWKKEIFPKYMLQKRILHLFEDTEFYVPYDSEKYLSLMYGDFTKLPPENERISHHKYSVKFLIEK